VQNLKSLEQFLVSHVHEREDVIRGLMFALGAKVHILLLGQPGTAKSLVIRLVAKALEKRYWSKQMNVQLTKEEFLGPIDVQSIKTGQYRYVTTDTLAEAEIAFLDEIFKANGVVNNLLLEILNEREAHVGGGHPIKVPLEVAMAASNELPADDEAREQFAFLDRLLLRFRVDYIKDDDKFVQMLLDEDDLDALMAIVPKVPQHELAAYQQAVKKVVIPQEVALAVKAIRAKMNAEGLRFSDRRYKHGLKVAKAAAAYDGRDTALLQDLEVYRNILWDEPSQAPIAARVVLEVADPILQEIEELLLEATEVADNALNARDSKDATSLGVEANAKLKEIAKRLDALDPGTQRGKDRLAEAKTRIQASLKEVLAKCLGIPL
jgi:MoxR-like ATPase